MNAQEDFEDNNGPTPKEMFFRAAKTGRFDDFKTYLYASKLRLNAKDGLGNTALHYASSGDHPRISHFILKTDPKVINVKSNIGDTPLHKAAARAKSQLVQLLVDNKADLLAKNNDGLRAMDLAKDPAVIELLTPAAIGSYSDDDDMDPFADDGCEDGEEDEDSD